MKPALVETWTPRQLYPLVNLPKNDGTSPFLIGKYGKSTISTGPFSIGFCMFTRGLIWCFDVFTWILPACTSSWHQVILKKSGRCFYVFTMDFTSDMAVVMPCCPRTSIRSLTSCPSWEHWSQVIPRTDFSRDQKVKWRSSGSDLMEVLHHIRPYFLGIFPYIFWGYFLQKKTPSGDVYPLVI